jgi:hypothetical protein
VAPSALCNVLPHIETISNARDAGVAVFFLMSVLVMAALPFAVKRLADPLHQGTCFVVGAVLLILNFANALDSGEVIQAYLTGSAREKLTRADGLRTEITRLETAQKMIAAHVVTSDETVTTKAADLRSAETSRDAECRRGRGPNCLSLGKQATDAKVALDKATRDRDLTREESSTKDAIAKTRQALADLGPLPKDVDPTAAKLIRIMAVVSPVTPYANETVSEWRKIGFALGVELLAFSGPMIILALFGVSLARKDTLPVVTQTVTHPSPVTHETPKDTPAPKKTPPKTPPKRTPKTDTETGDVGDWLKERTVKTPGEKLQCAKAHESYIGWCKGKKVGHLNLTLFGNAMRDTHKIDRIEENGRRHYRGIALKHADLKVVVG